MREHSWTATTLLIVRPRTYTLGMDPVGLHEQLPGADVSRMLLCTVCRAGLLYQRMEAGEVSATFLLVPKVRTAVRGVGMGLEPYVQSG